MDPITFGLICVALGAVLGNSHHILRGSIDITRRIASSSRRDYLNDAQEINSRLLNIHDSESLYEANIAGQIGPIPFLQTHNFRSFDSIELHATDVAAQNVTVRESAIRQMQRSGRKLIDNPHFFFGGIDRNRPHSVRMGICNYFAIASEFFEFEMELRSGRNQMGRLRRWYLSSRDKLELARGRHRLIGVATLLTLNLNGNDVVLLHRRSKETAIYGGAIAVAPNFGLSPPLNGTRLAAEPFSVVPSSDDRKSIFMYNLIKEFLEEIFDKEALIDEHSDAKIDPYWFYQMDEAQMLIRGIDAGAVSMSFLGAGFDLLHGGFVMSLAVKIENEELSAELVKRAKLNWEFSGKDGNQEFELVPISEIDVHRTPLDSFHPAAAFTVSEALKKFTEA